LARPSVPGANQPPNRKILRGRKGKGEKIVGQNFSRIPPFRPPALPL
jgi:hypothetical protein